MKRLLLMCSCLALFSLPVACGDSGPDEDPGSSQDEGASQEDEPLSAPAFLEQWEEAYVGASCETMFNGCADAVKISYWEGANRRIASEEACKERLDIFGDVWPAAHEVLGWVDDGQLSYDEAAAKDCLEAFGDGREQDSCWLPSLGVMEACRGAFAPQLTGGDSCVNEIACQSGQCEASWGASADQCDVVCTEAEALIGEGEQCDQQFAPELCDSSKSLVCEAGPDGSSGDLNGTCIKTGTLPEGSPCRTDSACAEGLICRISECTPLELGDVGDDCQLDGSASPCKPELVCVTEGSGSYSGTCKEPLGEGESCEHNEECRVDLFCDAIDNVCAKRVGHGEECQQDVACEEGLYCGYNGEGCTDQLGEGASCEYPAQCQGDLWCTDGECIDLYSDGDQCTAEGGTIGGM